MGKTRDLFKKIRDTKGTFMQRWLKTQHSKSKDHIIWSHDVMENRWENNGNCDRLIFLSSKIIADGDCSHKIERHLLLGRKAMTNLESVLKSRDSALRTKVYIVKATVFPVVMSGCDSWTIKNAKH